MMNSNSLDRAEINRAYGADPREIPLYSISQAARYLKMPSRTLRDWTTGRTYPIRQGQERKTFAPIIHLPKQEPPWLSFMNLIEAHVLNGMRRLENIPFPKVRLALKYIEEQFPSSHPLADNQFQTDGVDLFVEQLGQLLTVSRQGQVAFKELIESYLRRIERDFDAKPLRLYPFLKPTPKTDEPRQILIDPLISFGRPVLAGTGVPTDIIVGRFYSGDSMEKLAEDYGLKESQVEESIRYEAPTRKAA
jgi:uncharacterized protein (DUF433 family)